MKIQFISGTENELADRLSRWKSEKKMKLLRLTVEEQWIEGHRGHFGVEGTYGRLKEMGYKWSKQEVQRRVLQCKDCAKF